MCACVCVCMYVHVHVSACENTSNRLGQDETGNDSFDRPFDVERRDGETTVITKSCDYLVLAWLFFS